MVLPTKAEAALFGKAVRDRSRDRAGVGPESYKKHELFAIAASSQISALRASFAKQSRNAPGVIIDMHGGTGEGVPPRQIDLFQQAVSNASPAIAKRLGDLWEPPATVVLCESRHDRRHGLREVFGDRAEVLSNHPQILRCLSGCRYEWALVFNDPCGPKSHSPEIMREIARIIPRSDFIIAVNESGIRRLQGLKAEGDDSGKNAHMVAAARKARDKYVWMLDAANWRHLLGKRCVSRSRKTTGSQGFQGRIIIASNYLAAAAQKPPFEEIK